MWFLNNDDRNLFVTHRLIAPQRTFVLPSEGVNSNHFAPKATTPKSTFRFVLLSRLIFDKGIAKYAEAAKIIRAKHDNVECFLYGKIIAPSPQSVPETLIREWDTAGIVHYGGNILDVRPTIADADCVVLPSFYSEGVPRCLMEAMSMQKPIITTDNVGCKELIRDGENGYQCERKSAEDLARAMEKMIQLSCEERQKMGEAGRKLILEKFDEQRIIEIYHKKIDGYFDK